MYVIIDWTSHMSYVMCNIFLMYLHPILHIYIQLLQWDWMLKKGLHGRNVVIYIYNKNKDTVWERVRERPHWKLHSFRKSVNDSSI